MRTLGFLALALPLLPLQALAEPATKTKAFADCAALVASQADIVLGPDGSVEDIEGGCRAKNLVYGVSSFMAYSIDEITLRAPDLLASYPTGEIFTSAELDVRGVRIKPQTHSPLQDYIIGLNATSMHLRLAYTTEPEALTSAVEFEFSADELGRFALSAALSDFDNTDVDIDDISEVSGRLNRLDLTLEDRGLFATIFAPAVLNGFFEQDEDPSNAIMVMQESAVAMLAGLPEGALSPEALVTLGTMIRAFPKPEGDWHLGFASERGLSLEDVGAGDLATLAAILAEAEITATGEPVAR